MVRAVTNLATDMKGFLEATFLGTVMVNLNYISPKYTKTFLNPLLIYKLA